MKYVTPASLAPGPSSSAGMRRATAASRNATSAGFRNMYFSPFAGECPACCAAAAAGMAAPSAPTDFRKWRRPSDSSMPPPRMCTTERQRTPKSTAAADELHDLAAERVVHGVELIDLRQVIVLLHAREARAGAIALAQRRQEQRTL